jgi:beta-lactamase regulating signal transducer with metallopeptidase domain
VNSQEVAAFLVTVLVNGIWQAALLALVAWLVLRYAKGASATTRHAVLAAALLGAIVLPVATSGAGYFSAQNVQRVAAQREVIPLPPLSDRTRHDVTPPLGASTQRAPQDTAASAQAVRRPHFALPAVAIAAALVLWLAGALVLVVRLAVSLAHLERLKRDALPVPVGVRDRLERWDAAGKGHRDVRLCRSADVSVPIAVGIFDAMILLPDNLLADLPSDDLDRILLHELAHLRRGDDWLNALERFAEAVLFFNPAVRWIVGQLDLEREVACDDWVLERRSEAVPYAQCLVKLVESVAWPHRAAVAPGIFVTRRSISIRIERLLAKHRDVRLRVSFAPLATVSAVTLAVCVAGAYVSPSFAAVSTQPESGAPAVWTLLAPPPSSAKPHWSTAPAHAASPKHATPHTIASRAPAVQPSPPFVPTAVARLPAPERVAMGVRASETAAPLAPVQRQVAALSADESATPSPAMTGEDYIGEMASVGYSNLSIDELIRLKALGVTAQYVRDMEATGVVRHPAIEELTRLRALDVTPSYVRDMRAIFGTLNVEDLTRMRAVGVTPSYVAELKAAGLSDVGSERIVGLRAVGVDGAYIRALAAAGYPHLSAEEYKRARAVGIDQDFLKAVRAHGLHNLSLDELVRLKASGVME